MNVHGVYDTSATMKTFYSRTEYQTFLQQQAGMAGSAFGFYAGVKKAYGSSSVQGEQRYLALFSIDIDRCVIIISLLKRMRPCMAFVVCLSLGVPHLKAYKLRIKCNRLAWRK